jgi:hypothetical protein
MCGGCGVRVFLLSLALVVLVLGKGPPHGRIHDPAVAERVVDIAESSLEEELRNILLYTAPMDSTVVTQSYFIQKFYRYAVLEHRDACVALQMAYDATLVHMRKFHYPYDSIPVPSGGPPQLSQCGQLPSDTMKRLRLAKRTYIL